MKGRRASAVWVCLAAALPAAGQHFSHLYGHILDPSEAGIPQAFISIVNEDTGFRRTAESLPDGSYSITSLQPGPYRMVVRKEGFRTVIRFGMMLAPARPTRLNLTLPVGSMQDAITVEGDTPAPIGGNETSVSTVIAQPEIEKLPMNGRGMLTLLELVPGTVATPATRGEPGQFTVNGQRPNANYFVVDGVSANNGVSGGGVPAQATGGTLPGLSAFGSMDSLISIGAIQEFRVRTSTTTADFGRLPGATVSVSSRSGSSEFHGSIPYRFRHERLGANDWFANRAGVARAPLRLHHVSPSLGGPILRSRTFFFIAYDGIRLRQPYAWRSPVPSAEAREAAAEWVQPILRLFPAPNGPALGPLLGEWTGRNRQPAGLDSGSFRIDHALTSRLTLFARYHDSPSFNEFGNTQVNRLKLRAQSATLGLNFRPSPNLIFDLRLNQSKARADSAWYQRNGDPCALATAISEVVRSPGTCQDFIRFSIAGVGQLASGREGIRRQVQHQAVGSTAWNFRGHSFRLGADFRRLAPRRLDAARSVSVLAETLEDLTDTRYLWSGTSPAQRGAIVVKELSVWLHDTWELTPRLTLTGGLRWEDNPAPVPRDAVYFYDPEQESFFSEHRPLWPRTYTSIAPRAGLAWRVDSNGNTVVRAGGGWYYESSLSIATDSINGGPLSVSQHGSARYAPFPSLLGFGFLPGLQLPTVAQWNFVVEHAFSRRDAVTAGYIGSSGRRLLRREMGGAGSRPTIWVATATNNGQSVYHGLQLQYRRRFAPGIQAIAAYTWSHSIDNSSSDSLLHWAGSGLHPRDDRASSDFDLRHSFSAGFAADLGRGWSLDGLVRARSGFPFTVLASEQYNGITLANAFRPDFTAGPPVWLADSTAPEGRRLSRASFHRTSAGRQGTLGRNSLAGFGMGQLDLAVKRDFRLGARAGVQLVVEAFNALNRASFADPVRFLDSPLFGQSASMLNLMLGTGSPGSGLAPIFQNGAPRSIQIGLRFSF